MTLCGLYLIIRLLYCLCFVVSFIGLCFKLLVCGAKEFFKMEEMLRVVRSNLVDLPTNVSLSYYWCSGFMISSFLLVQLVSGIILSFLYVADAGLRFSCVCDFTNDSLFVWIVRYSHI